MTDSELMILEALQNLGHQLQAINKQLERLNLNIEIERAEKEQRWYPEGYDDESTSDL